MPDVTPLQPIPADALGPATALARRMPLLTAMEGLAAAGIGCSACTGVCCTFVANSMQITLVEALDILAALERSGRLTLEETARWAAAVARFGLDRPLPGDGRRGMMRRRYTCPFFAEGKLGCTLPPAAKPYGCLTYNARRAGIVDGEACGSQQALLDAVEVTAEVHAAARAWAGDAATDELLPIPVALLRLVTQRGVPAP